MTQETRAHLTLTKETRTILEALPIEVEIKLKDAQPKLVIERTKELEAKVER